MAQVLPGLKPGDAAPGETALATTDAPLSVAALNHREDLVLFGKGGAREGEDVVATLRDAATGLAKLAAQHVALTLMGTRGQRERMTIADRYAMEAFPRLSAELKQLHRDGGNAGTKDVTPASGDPIGDAARGDTESSRSMRIGTVR